MHGSGGFERVGPGVCYHPTNLAAVLSHFVNGIWGLSTSTVGELRALKRGLLEVWPYSLGRDVGE